MRPNLKTLEEVFLEKLNPIINNVKDNKTAINKSEIESILIKLQRTINRFKYENARAGERELNQLKILMDNFVRLVTENENLMSFYERLLERADKSTDKPVFQQIVDEAIKQRPDENPVTVANMLFAHWERLSRQMSACEKYRDDFSDVFSKFFGDTTTEHRGQSRFDAIRDETQGAINAIYEIQNKTNQPHHSFNLKNAFDAFKVDFFNQFEPLYSALEKNQTVVKKLLTLAPEFKPDEAIAQEDPALPASPARSGSALFSRTGSSASSSDYSCDLKTDSEQDEETEEGSETAASSPRSHAM